MEDLEAAIAHNAKILRTSFSCGKYKEIISHKKLTDPSLFPINI